MELLQELGVFLAKFLIVIVLLGGGLALLLTAGQRHRREQDGYLEVHCLNDRYRDLGDSLSEAVLDPHGWKQLVRQRRKAEKKEHKEQKARRRKARAESADAEQERPATYVLDFDGDLQASGCEALREEISALLGHVRSGDEVLLRLESPGGLVHSYGLAASELRRLRDAGVRLVISVDAVAASGGYLMACVADRILAAPFAVVGSIGVVAQLPNFHRLLRRNEIDFEVLTAGQYKRTLTIFGENTAEGRRKFVEELEDTHGLFKEFVKANRPALDLDRVATGEVWYGERAINLGLVDELLTSDSYIQQALEKRDVFEVSYRQRRSWQEKLGLSAELALDRVLLRWWGRARETRGQLS